MLFNPRYGRVGFLAMPFYAFGEMLAPVVVLVGYLITGLGLAFGLVNVSFALLFVLVAWGYGMLLSIWAVVLEEVSFRRYRRFTDMFRLLLFASLENFGYRQCTVWWRLKAFANVAKGVHAWGDMTRKGFGKPSVAALLALCLATPCLGQTARISGWGSYEAVTASQDWSTLGAQLTLTSTRGAGGFAVAAVIFARDPTARAARRRQGELRAQRGPILTRRHGFVRSPTGDSRGLSEARRREAEGEERGDARFAESFARHVAPGVYAFRHVGECLEPPPHGALAIAEVFQRREEQQPKHVGEATIAAEAHFLEHYGPDGQQHAVSPRDEEEQQRERHVHEAE